jgi:hypothetical protein
MKSGLLWTGDPALHLIAVATALAAAALALGAPTARSHANVRVHHPPGCHACSVCSPEAMAARDAFLIQSGSIAPEDGE